MKKPEYTKIIALLDSAKTVLAANVGSLSPADLRIRSLVNITGKEAERALLELAAEAGLFSSPAAAAQCQPGNASSRPAPVPASAGG